MNMNVRKPNRAIKTNLDPARSDELKRILNDLRARVMTRVRELRRDQEADVVPPPADEMDVARSLADVETHAGLIERAEDRLRSIDEALVRLERGRYGICQGCAEMIPTERLRAMPLAAYCVDCQTEANRAARVGLGDLSRSVRKRWSIPEELDESLETQDTMRAPEEDAVVHRDRPFGPEEGVESMEPDIPRRRRRATKTRAK